MVAHIPANKQYVVLYHHHTITNAREFYSVDEWYFLVGWFCEYTSPLYFSLSLSQWTSLSTAMTFAKLYCNIITWLYASKKEKYRIESFYLFRVFIFLFSLYSFSLDSSTDCGKKYRMISHVMSMKIVIIFNWYLKAGANQSIHFWYNHLIYSVCCVLFFFLLHFGFSLDDIFFFFIWCVWFVCVCSMWDSMTNFIFVRVY